MVTKIDAMVEAQKIINQTIKVHTAILAKPGSNVTFDLPDGVATPLITQLETLNEMYKPNGFQLTLHLTENRMTITKKKGKKS